MQRVKEHTSNASDNFTEVASTTTGMVVRAAYSSPPRISLDTGLLCAARLASDDTSVTESVTPV